MKNKKKNMIKILMIIIAIIVIFVAIKNNFYNSQNKDSITADVAKFQGTEIDEQSELKDGDDIDENQSNETDVTLNSVLNSRTESSTSLNTISITFEDLNMYNKICEELKDKIAEKNDSNKLIVISSENIEATTTLNLNNSNITKINGIEKFTYIKELNISNNNITDISCISSLDGITKLNACGNVITDISPISNLINLNYLNISNNKLIDITENSENNVTKKLTKLTKLNELDISHNYLIYINGLESLNKLTKLNLYDNAIHDLTEIGTLTNLTELNLGENDETSIYYDITGLESLNNLINLKYLNFSENKTASVVDNITKLKNLETLSLQGNKITDISSLLALTKLKELNLYDNAIKTIPSQLLNLSDLEILVLGKNDIRSIIPLCNQNDDIYTMAFSKMKKLDLSNNKYIYTQYESEQSSGSDSRIKNNSLIIDILKNNLQELNYEYITDTSNLPHYDEKGAAYVTYDDFGAKCDGIYDDFIAIRNAHLFANKYGYEVRATNGKTYNIYKYYENYVHIKTDVNWENANFIIHDEEIENVSGRYNSIFKISNIEEKVTINNPNWTITTKTKNIPELSDTLKRFVCCCKFREETVYKIW